jgi:hypothetical protein
MARWYSTRPLAEHPSTYIYSGRPPYALLSCVLAALLISAVVAAFRNALVTFSLCVALVLFGATLVLWARSFQGEAIGFGRERLIGTAIESAGWRVHSEAGGLVIWPTIVIQDPAGRLPVGAQLSWSRVRAQAYPYFRPNQTRLKLWNQMGFQTTLYRNDFSVPAPRGFPGPVASIVVRETGRYTVVPWWFVSSLAFLPVIVTGRIVFLRVREARRIARGVCGHCEYDLRMSIERCPECGERIGTGAGEHSNIKERNLNGKDDR